MNLKEYIASGIIESYVMGIASEAERTEFEQMCAQYPELVAERRKFEESLEAYASEQSMRPPKEVKAKILKAIITMENSTKPRSIGLLRFVAAAAAILLIGMVVLYYQVNQQNKELANTNKLLSDKINADEGAINKIKREVSIPNTTIVNMVGTKRAPQSTANVYWDSTNSNVYLMVTNMPQLPSNKQYQLWALIDKTQKSLGVFDAADQNIILKMDSTKKAQAFAITIENRGGKPHPTLDSLTTMGKTELTQ
ncbi:MAG TPA: anti-sigma factor [Puia sp.]|nr:anti-sigma factor [Puia sp.]